MIRFVFLIVVSTCIIYVDSFVAHAKKPIDEAKTLEVENTLPPHDEEMKNRRSIAVKKSGRKSTKKRTPKLKDARKMNENSALDSLMLALQTSFENNTMFRRDDKPHFVDKYAKQIIEFFKSNTGPMFRAADKKYDIKPELIHLRSEKPAIKLDINAKTIAGIITDLLKSEMFKTNFDKIVKQAGIIYHSLHDSAPKNNNYNY